ncbi:histone-lysine N-methyltransferase ATXR4 isoform X2 [Magnolia sinica]|uniref:histone-lysine N-methyltransferase ATXR4 isoform X2 n=1 Tax=Magnolia sinica TaxID=86752 RepID=UPI0026588998|nr:histone-lysine N-methyltransferase ATXR4 isoform X2 [Magnolia sinica]
MFRTISHRWGRLKQLQSTNNYNHNNPSPSFLFSLSTTATANNNSSSKSSALPPPIRVSLTDSAGRGTFATRRIGAGDLIHTAKPLISHPSISLILNVCYFCLKRLGMDSSAISAPLEGNRRTDSTPTGPALDVDRRVYFCSEECRENSKVFYEVEKMVDWSAFDDHCRLRGLKYPFLVKRLACMIISGAASVDFLDILQPANLFPEMILEMEEEFHLLRCTLLKAGFDEQIAFLTKQWYIGVLVRIRINAFRVELIGGSYEDLLSAAAASIVAESAVGNAVYMLPSFYNHDCVFPTPKESG